MFVIWMYHKKDCVLCSIFCLPLTLIFYVKVNSEEFAIGTFFPPYIITLLLFDICLKNYGKQN